MSDTRAKRSYPLATSTWDEAELAAAQRVLRTGAFTMGERVAAFEEAFALFVGSRHAVMVNSGSSANLLAVAALCHRKTAPLRPGDEAVVPAVSWATTYYPLSQYGLKLKFVDVDLETLNYDLQALEGAISERTRVLICVNLLGNPNDFNTISSILAGRDIILVEDNCESLGAEYHGKQAGTYGLLGTFSTFYSHHMCTMEGGVVVTDDDELHQLLLSLRAHGWTRPLPRINLVTGTKSDDAFEESYRFVLPGYNLRPTELMGAVGFEQLRKLPDMIAARRRNATIFKTLFGDHPDFLSQREIGRSSWFGFSLVIRRTSSLSRSDVVRRLQEASIECRPIVAGNFVKNPVISRLDHTIHGDLNNADQIDRAGLFVGNHHYDLSAELQYLWDVLESPGKWDLESPPTQPGGQARHAPSDASVDAQAD